MAVSLREIYRQQNKPTIWEPSIPLQALEGRKRKERDLLSQFPQRLFVPFLFLSQSVLPNFFLQLLPPPQLTTLALVFRTIHFKISTHQQQKRPDF